MKIFPTSTYHVELNDNYEQKVHSLKIYTEENRDVSAVITDKMFIGKIEQDGFKLTGSEIGIGPFTVFTGTFTYTIGTIKTEINIAFKILISILYLLPIVFISLSKPTLDLRLLIYIIPILISTLSIRFIFVFFMNKLASNFTMDKLKIVLDIKLLERIGD